MRICHVITRMIIGGAQENTALSCAGLAERGHTVTLATGPETGPEGSLIDEARAGGYDLRIVRSLRRSVHPLRDWKARRELMALFREIRPDIVHTHSSKAGVLARLAARDASVPIIVHTIHGMSFNRTQPWPVRALYRGLEVHCARFTDRIISVADAMTRQAEAAGLKPRTGFTTIYSGMRTDWFDPARHDRRTVRRDWGFDDEQIVVGTIARLFRNKGYEQLIPAMVEAARRNGRLRFLWVGDGAQRPEYEARLECLSLHGRVHMAGLIPPGQIPAALAGMDILVHASQWEGLPRAAAQALLMRKPVISFDIDGAPEVVIPGRTGLLVPLNDVRALADAMVELATDPARRQVMGQAGRELCLRRFDAASMIDRLEQVYNELAGRCTEQHPAG
ncbi:MAG TPA: glycosyltransferase family 4 protein [Phycisphaerae bacterium]|nr:glycosyltransferase family 4 protein [Phycisphaerae bacterium]